MNKINTEELLKKSDEIYFSTGFEDIDECMLNVDKGSIITIGSRPAMGKTSLAFSILNYLLEENKKVFYFSPSNTIKMIEKLLIINKLGIDFFHFEKELKSKGNLFKKTLEYYSDKEFYISDKTNLTVEDIENEIKENIPDVVFIDYIQLLKMPKAPNFTDSINLAVQELKRIAQETGVIFVILTQLSRGVEERCDRRPLLYDIRNSSLLEELSDVVMMIYRESYYNFDDETNKNLAEIIFRKNNFGPLSVIMLRFEKGRFSNVNDTTF